MSHADAPDAASVDRDNRSIRNPRRRARPDSESIKTAPRRKRSKIAENTFLPRDDDAADADDAASMNGHATRHTMRSTSLRKPSNSTMNTSLDIPLRSRSGARRLPRADPATVLTQNETYNIKLLSNTPRELRRKDTKFRGSIDVQNSLALAITHDKAYIWDHTGHSGTLSTKTIEIPSELSTHNTIPYGALVAGGPGIDVGLLLVSAHTGKVLYHESINRVTTQSFFSDRKEGVTASISGLFSGEHVVQLVSAHPAGFVAVLSSGRLVHLTLRDPQGKPKIRSQVLYAGDQGGGGVLSSLKNILGAHSWKQTVSAVRTRALERGQIQILALLEKGEIRTWNIDWSGHHEYQQSFDFREDLQKELREMQTAEMQSSVDQLAVVGLAITERSGQSMSQDLVTTSSDRPIHVTVLVRGASKSLELLYLVQLSLHNSRTDIRRILTVQSAPDQDHTFRPQLLVPAPYNVALIIRSSSVSILSLLVAASDPEAQLHEASYIEPEPYQDTIFLREHNHHILGADLDGSRLHADASGVLFVQGAGLLRVAVDAIPQETQPWEAVKSRLEQAVFYGNKEGNVLDLSTHAGPEPSTEDVERAALILSNEVFTNSSAFLDMPPVSVESSLSRRASALHSLAEVLQKTYQPLPKSAMWTLLTHAEKIAAGQRLWSLYEHSTIESKTRKVANLWQEIMQCVEDKHAFPSIYEHLSTEDVIRTFFVTQLARVSDLLEFACRVMNLVAADDSDAAHGTAIRIASEADNIWLDGLQTVFQFRTDNSALYGISSTKLEDGIITQPADLQDIDELWTSSNTLVSLAPKLTEEVQDIAAESYGADTDPTVDQLAVKIASENSRLVELSCLIFRERITWCFSRGTQKYNEQAEKIQQAFEVTRHNQIRALANLGQSEAGLKLAEKYQDMETLTTMIIAESQYLCENLLVAPPSARSEIENELERNNRRVSKYFDLYGDEFAEAFFGHSFASGKAGHMLAQASSRWNDDLTAYLRKDPARGKVCWINDVLQQKDFEHAGQTLLNVATTQEQNVWSKTVELSLAKLSMQALGDKSLDETHAALQNVDKELAFMAVQDRLYKHVYPATYQSLDADTAIKDALSAFARGALQSYSLHYSLLGDLISKVLSHRTLHLDELIDVLTLIDAHAESREDRDLNRSETFEALTALYASPQSTTAAFDLLLKLIWKRALLQEDWEQLNTVASRDGDVAARDFVIQTNLYCAIYSIFNAKTANEEDRMQILTPEQTLGAGTFSTDLPQYVTADIVEHYLEERVKMEQELENLIQEQRLNSWLPDIIRYAKDAVWAAAEEQDEKARWTAEDEAHVNGYGANGYTNGIKTEDDEDLSGEPREPSNDIMMM